MAIDSSKASVALWALTLVAMLAPAPGSADEAVGPQTPSAAGEAQTPTPEPDPGAPDELLEDEEAPAPELDPVALEVSLEAAEPQPREVMEEMVITGVRYRDLLQNVPISITFFDAAELKELRIQNIADLAQFTPNLEINTAFAASNPTIFIRGIGLKDYNANAAGSVAVYQDGIYINSPAGQLFQMFDVESVEVNRGPQGSIKGRNATAGAIIVNSFKPDGEWSVSGDFTYGNYDTFQGNGAIGFPILEEVLSARVAFTANFADGYLKNACAGQTEDSLGQGGDPACFGAKNSFPPREPDPDAPGGLSAGPRNTFLELEDPLNNSKNWATRGLIHFQPTDGQDWLFNFHWGQNRSDSLHLQSCGLNDYSDKVRDSEGNPVFPVIRFGPDVEQARELCVGENSLLWRRPIPPGSDPVTEFADNHPKNDPHTGYYDQDGEEKLDILGSSLTGIVDLGSWSFLGDVWLVTITGYEENDREVGDEGDASPADQFSATWKDGAWQVSQELRLEGAGENHSWVAGGYFLHEELEADNFLHDATNRDVLQPFNQTLWYWAPFATLRFDFSERWSAQGGVRYNWEKKHFDLDTTEVLDGVVTPGIDKKTAGDTWTGVTGDFTLFYSPVEQVTAYAKYARAMKGGHFNAGVTGPLGIVLPVEPEFVHAVELGAKGRLFDDRFTFSFSGFRYWYQDLQVFDIVNEVGRSPTQQLLNTDARVWGVELEIQARPLPGLSVRASGGWLDSKFVDFEVMKQARPRRDRCVDCSAQEVTLDYSGNSLISAPAWSASGLVEYELALPRGLGSIVPQFSFSWRSEHFFDPSGAKYIACADCEVEQLGDQVLSQSAYWLLNARLAYRWTDRYEIAGWVQNLTDAVYLVDAFDLWNFNQSVLQVYGRPRTYGVTVSYRF